MAGDGHLPFRDDDIMTRDAKVASRTGEVPFRDGVAVGGRGPAAIFISARHKKCCPSGRGLAF